MATSKKPTDKRVYIALAAGLFLVLAILFFGRNVAQEPVAVEEPAIIETDR